VVRRPKKPSLFRMSASAPPPPRIWALSDLHTDYPENRAWCDSIASSTRYRRDVLLVAGDVSDDTDILQRTLRGFVRAFGAVFFTPGNHDVWVRRAASHPHSLAKLHRLLEMCEEIGVRTRPMFVNGVSHSTHASHMSDPTFPIYHRIYLTHSFPHATPPFFSISHRHFFFSPPLFLFRRRRRADTQLVARVVGHGGGGGGLGGYTRRPCVHVRLFPIEMANAARPAHRGEHRKQKGAISPVCGGRSHSVFSHI